MFSFLRLSGFVVSLLLLFNCSPPGGGSTTTTYENGTNDDPTSGIPSLSSQGSQTTVRTLSGLSSGSFQLSDNTTSFLLSAFSSGTARITRLVSPSGRDELAYLESTASGLTSFGDGQYDNYLVPMRPDIDAEAGIWTYQISGANELKLTVREDNPSTSGESSLLLQPYLASGQSYNLDTAWQLVKGLYSNNSLNVTIADPITISEEQYRTVSDSFFNAETQALVT